MARVDYEAAWTALQAYAASQTSHGQKDLLVKMAQLADEHRIPEDLLERAARIVGGPILITTAEGQPASPGDSRIDERMADDPPPTYDQGGHDGRRDRGRASEPVRT
ncbi:MAG: hypothetical protein ACRDPE_15155 [Solirubrobacterales bacterium]